MSTPAHITVAFIQYEMKVTSSGIEFVSVSSLSNEIRDEVAVQQAESRLSHSNTDLRWKKFERHRRRHYQYHLEVLSSVSRRGSLSNCHSLSTISTQVTTSGSFVSMNQARRTRQSMHNKHLINGLRCHRHHLKDHRHLPANNSSSIRLLDSVASAGYLWRISIPMNKE